VSAPQGEIRMLKPMTAEDASAKLLSIFDDLQTRFHDQWDWMDADFSLMVLEAHLRAAREERDHAKGLADYWSDKWQAERKARQRAEEAIEAADATLCECRYSGLGKKDCNCDIHAAHQILRAALSKPVKEPAEQIEGE